MLARRIEDTGDGMTGWKGESPRRACAFDSDMRIDDKRSGKGGVGKRTS